MKILQEIARSSAATRLLQPRFRLLTSAVGACSGLVGVALVALLAKLAHLRNPTQMIHGLPGIAALLGFCLAIAAFLYLGCVIVAGLFGWVLVYQGKLSKKEALEYALYSRYPKHWFAAGAQAGAATELPAAPGRR